MGLGMQLVSWPDPFCQMLVQRGFRVVRFDNRDCGLSQKMDHLGKPHLVRSMIRASLGLPVGAIHQDRATAIAGTLGPLPPTVPVRISLESDRGQRHAFALQVADDQMLTPLLTYLSLLSVLSSYERASGAATFTVTGETR